jgi:citrate synthase
MNAATVHEGLAGVLVAKTSICSVDGERGRLSVRGRPIEELSGVVSFEAQLRLLLGGDFPEFASERAAGQELGQGRLRAFELLAPRFGCIATPDAMATLRSAVSLLPAAAGPGDVLGVVAVASAGWIRRELGEQLLAPRPGLPHTADLLRMSHGGEVSAADVRLLEAYLVTVAEHGFNASTFAARVTASTGADLAAAVVAGLSALSGPLHGGAPGPVLDMLDAVAVAKNARSFVQEQLSQGRRIMGMGHRVYRVRDPRALVLERALAEHGASARLELARAVEAAAQDELARKYPERALCANVEFYTALLLEALRMPRAAFSAIFACGRVAGYAAHFAEQRSEGRLIRPSALYVGPNSESPPIEGER